jgi:hypothetical protein
MADRHIAQTSFTADVVETSHIASNDGLTKTQDDWLRKPEGSRPQSRTPMIAIYTGCSADLWKMR